MKSDHNLYHNVISFNDWPKPPRSAPAGNAEPALELELGVVVREVLDALWQNGEARTSERVVHIRNFRSETYKLVDDLVISLEEYPDFVVARSFDTGQYAYGPSVDDALANLCATIGEYYDILREERENLSRPLALQLKYLEGILEKL